MPAILNPAQVFLSVSMIPQVNSNGKFLLLIFLIASISFVLGGVERGNARKI